MFQLIKETVICEAKWIRMLQYDYATPDGNIKHWELCERTTRAGSSDAVDVTAIIKKRGEEDKIVLVKQYRPPMNGYTIEMPAGLVDFGEEPETSAIRELKEETGYTGTTVGKASPPIASDPGITNSNIQMVNVIIDGDAEYNQTPKPAVEDENIETIILPLKNLRQKLDAFAAEGHHVDSRLYHFAAGLELALSFLC